MRSYFQELLIARNLWLSKWNRIINFSSSKLSVIGYLPHPKLSKHHKWHHYMVKSKRESFDECQQIFIVKFISRRKIKFEGILWSFNVKIFNGRIHIIFRLRRVICWIIRVHRQIIRLIIHSKYFPDSDWLKAHA